MKQLFSICFSVLSIAIFVWDGFKKNLNHSSKNKLQQIQLSDTTGTSNGTGLCGQMKQKKNMLDGFGAHKDKKYPYVYNLI